MSGPSEVGDVLPLSALAEGRSARVVHVGGDDPNRMARLSSMGLVPGAVVEIRRQRPATVLKVAETVIAIDGGIAESIWVRPLSGSSAGGVAVATRGRL